MTYNKPKEIRAYKIHYYKNKMYKYFNNIASDLDNLKVIQYEKELF